MQEGPLYDKEMLFNRVFLKMPLILVYRINTMSRNHNHHDGCRIWGSSDMDVRTQRAKRKDDFCLQRKNVLEVEMCLLESKKFLQSFAITVRVNIIINHVCVR